MKDVVLIDGYNAINKWFERTLLKDELNYARDRFIDIVANYAAFCGLEAILVFDAANVRGGLRREESISDVVVVFTNEGETADGYIEKSAYNLTRQGRRVYVVTSDWAEQIMVLGAGAYRISVREFYDDINKLDKQMRADFSREGSRNTRQEIGNRLNGDVVELLNKWRRGG